MRKKICVILMIVLFINMMSINVFATVPGGPSSFPGITAPSDEPEEEEQETPSKPSTDTAAPSTMIDQSVVEKEEITEVDKLREKLKNFGVKIENEGTSNEKWTIPDKTIDPTNYNLAIQVLGQVTPELIAEMSTAENRGAFNAYKKSIEIINSKESNEETLVDQTQKVEDEEEKYQEELEKEQQAGASTGLLGNADADASHTPDEIIGAAQDFLNKGNAVTTIDGNNLNAASSTLYNILLSIGIFLSVGVGMYLGVKFMVSTAEDKAKVKEALIPYIAGCIVIFSAFVIWKAAILLLGGIG